jgi:copper chaperone
MERKTLAVTGMSCNGCEQNVENALRSLDGVSRVEADHGADTVDVVVDDDVSDTDLTTAIEGAGYDVVA